MHVDCTVSRPNHVCNEFPTNQKQMPNISLLLGIPKQNILEETVEMHRALRNPVTRYVFKPIYYRSNVSRIKSTHCS